MSAARVDVHLAMWRILLTVLRQSVCETHIYKRRRPSPSIHSLDWGQHGNIQVGQYVIATLCPPPLASHTKNQAPTEDSTESLVHTINPHRPPGDKEVNMEMPKFGNM